MPRGLGKYEQKAGETELEIYVRQVNPPIGTVLTVFVDNASVGQLTLRNGGEGQIELENEHGQLVPAVANGSILQIKNGADVILSGAFAAGFRALKPCGGEACRSRFSVLRRR